MPHFPVRACENQKFPFYVSCSFSQTRRFEKASGLRVQLIFLRHADSRKFPVCVAGHFFADTQDCESFHLRVRHFFSSTRRFEKTSSLRVQQIFLRHANSKKLPVACPTNFSLTRKFEKASGCVSGHFFSDTQIRESFRLRVQQFFLWHADSENFRFTCPANFSLTRKFEKNSGCVSHYFFSDTQIWKSFQLRVQQILLWHANLKKASGCVSSKFFSDTQIQKSFRLREPRRHPLPSSLSKKRKWLTFKLA